MSQINALELDTAPAAQILTTSEAKNYLKVDSSTDDALIDSLVIAATYKVEAFLNKKLINQTWKLWLDYFPESHSKIWWDGTREAHINTIISKNDFIEIPLGPLSSITYLKTYDTTDTAYTMDSAQYFVDTKKGHGRIYVKKGYSWPTTDLRNGNGIEIKFIVGYGASSSSVPSPIIAAAREVLGVLYDCRGASEVEIPLTAKSMLEPYKFINI